MPTYTYHCPDCGRAWEVQERPEAKQVKRCECGGKARRLFPCPAIVTDTAYAAPMGGLEKQFGGNKKALRDLARQARAQGYNPSPDDIYEPGLAQQPGDPKAFFKSHEIRSGIKRRCQELGVAPIGDSRLQFDVPARPERELAKKPQMPKKIVDRMVRQAIKEDPALAAKPRKELRDQIVQKHSYSLPE